MLKTHISAAVVLIGCLAASAAPVDTCGFEKVPNDALKALQMARGKPFTAGAVFVNGKYIPPPYVVSRYGTAIMINGCQVTGQIVPWYKFTGVRPAPAAPKPRPAARPASRPAASAPAEDSLDDLFGDEPSAPAPEPPAAKAPEKANEYKEAKSIDDLFADDDEDAPPQPAAAKPAAGKPAAPAAEAAAPQKKFVHTARTRQLLETIDKERTTIDRNLRSNCFYFFSPRYSTVRGNLLILGSMAEKLPDAMRDSTSADDLYARLRRSGLGFVSAEVCTDLYANRLTFPSLYDLRSRMREVIEERKAALSVEHRY